MRRYEALTAAVVVLIAAVAMFDTRRGALPDVAGGAPGGLSGGFYPFWSAAVLFAFSAMVLLRSLVVPQSAEGVFKDRSNIISVLWLAIPMVVATALIGVLGFYLMTGLYMGFFAAVIGRYRWHWVGAITVLFPLVIYLAFEVGFRVGLPKSIFFDVLHF
ncbi:MAG: tripartite tricarboxylate transporter TctB family protein [Candidatus Limnocylindria bacterium]